MTKRLELYKCNVCGNLIQIILEGEGELICCGEPMNLLTPQTLENELNEKHVPIFVKNENGEQIRIGETLHPMTKEHYIQFVECISKNNKDLRLKYFSLEEDSILDIDENKEHAKKALAYCNIHGLWEGNND